MRTFIAVNDAMLVERMQGAERSIVYAAPGVSKAVAHAIGKRLEDLDVLDITVILDSDEDVCRLGYGDLDGLKTLHGLACSHHIALRKQAGLRMGVLVVDGQVLVWSPTPQSVEEARSTDETPNGISLGNAGSERLVRALSPEGAEATVAAAEVGKSPVTPKDVEDTESAIDANPVIPVELSRITRVFSTKLQFVELEIKSAKRSETRLSLPKELLNADANGEIRQLIDSRITAFRDVKNVSVPVTAVTTDGEVAYGRDGLPLKIAVSEAELNRIRQSIERRYLFMIPGHGALIARSEKEEFRRHLDTYRRQIEEYDQAIREVLETRARQVVDETVALVRARIGTAGRTASMSPESIREHLMAQVRKKVEVQAEISLRFKDVTFEHTQDEEFRAEVRRAMPAHIRARLGTWDEHFNAARQA